MVLLLWRGRKRARNESGVMAAPVLALAVLSQLFTAAHADQAGDLYCGGDNCYSVLQLPSPHDGEAPTETEIKKAYRKLSLVWHPDKCKGDECESTFVAIAKAYEVLSDNETRADYDYALEHPDAVFYNNMKMYKHTYAPQLPLWLVVVGFLLLLSAIQWPLMWGKYLMYMSRAKETSAYKQKVVQLGEGGLEGTVEEDSDPDIEIELVGCPRPEWHHLVVFQLPLLPARVAYRAWRIVRWIMKYNVLGHAYDRDAKVHLTLEILRIRPDIWDLQPLEKQEELLSQAVWTKKGMKEFQRRNRIAWNQKRKKN